MQEEKFIYMKKQDGDLMKVTEKKMDIEVADIITLIQDIQEHLNAFFKECKQVGSERGIPKEELIKSMKELTRAMDSHIESSLITMYQKSLASFRDLILYMGLGITFHEENLYLSTGNQSCSIFDYYLSNNMYLLRHKAFEKFRMAPSSMESCLHPRLLACHRTPALWRRANYISHVVMYISKMAKNGRLQSIRNAPYSCSAQREEGEHSNDSNKSCDDKKVNQK